MDQRLGLEFFLRGLTGRLQIGLFLVGGIAVIMAIIIGFSLWQERTAKRP